MFRAGKLTCVAVAAAGLVAAFTMLGPGPATAATGTAGAGTAAGGAGGPATFALMAAPPKTFTATYSCDLMPYSASSSVTVSATLMIPATASTLSPVVLTLKTTSVALPSSVLSQLSGVDSFGLTASVQAKQNAESAPVPLSGKSAVSGTLKGLPAVTATSPASASQALEFAFPGTAYIEVPAPTLTFTPSTASAALSVITCSTTAATKAIPVTVTDGVIGPKTGPLYNCKVSASAGDLTVPIEQFEAHVPMTVTSSGSRTTGKSDTVTLGAAVGGYPAGATSIRFSTDLPVQGAQSGKIALSERVTDLASAVTKASGKLALTKAGTDRILVPETFTITLDQQLSEFSGTFTFAFTLMTKPVPVGLTVQVTAGPQASGSPSPSSTGTGNGGQPEGSGTPAGAPATGGGTGPGADMAVVGSGAAIAFGGGGLVIFGRRRGRNRSRNR
jgi:hypothetical protein